MKLVRYGKSGQEKPGLIDDEGNLRDLSRKVGDISGEFFIRQVAEDATGIECKKVEKG